MFTFPNSPLRSRFQNENLKTEKDDLIRVDFKPSTPKSWDREIQLGNLIQVLVEGFPFKVAVSRIVKDRIPSGEMERFLKASGTDIVYSWKKGAFFMFDGLMYRIDAGKDDAGNSVLAIRTRDERP